MSEDPSAYAERLPSGANHAGHTVFLLSKSDCGSLEPSARIHHKPYGDDADAAASAVDLEAQLVRVRIAEASTQDRARSWWETHAPDVVARGK
jgi:hypothetical protein